MQPTIDVDLSQALLRFSQAGIPEQVRTNLRNLLPPLARTFVSSVESKMDSELKSHNTITMQYTMTENIHEVTATIQMLSPSASGLLPIYLELGTVPHPIYPRGDYATFWFEKLGRFHTYTQLHPIDHPGTKAYAFMDRTLSEMMPEIQDTLQRAQEGLNE
jgi:hypothetical protein